MGESRFRRDAPMRGGVRVSVIRVALLCAALTIGVAGPAAALTCGGSGQPECVESPPPGVELQLSEAENPYGLQPVAAPTANGAAPLWPTVRGHKPYGFNAVGAGRWGTTIDDEAHLHEQIAAPLARVGADWAMIQYYPGPSGGGPAWNYKTYLDPRYRAYVRRGIRPLLMLARTPRRFTSNADTPANSNVAGCGTSDACWNPPRRRHLDDLATFAADLAKRYPLIAGIEVWNEPNLSNPFWGTEPVDPEHYTRMLRTVHDAVKAVRPNLPVIGGAVSNVSADGADRMSDTTFIRRMLEAGATSKMDAVSHHPYIGPFPWGTAPDRRFATLNERIVRNGRALRDAYDQAGVPMNDRVVVTEMGASTTAGYNLTSQKDWVGYQYSLYNTGHAGVPLADRTDGVILHQAVEDPEPMHGNTWQAGYGFTYVKDASGAFGTKPVYCWFRTVVGGFADCPASITP